MARNDSFNQPWASVPAQFERPGDGLIARGWAGGASEDPPEAKWENWWHNRVDLALQELQNLGQLIWFTDAPYQAGVRVSHGGNSYIALSENTGVEPTGALDIGVWRKEGASTYLQTANNLAEIAAAGPEAIATAIANLGLTDTAAIATNALQKNQNLNDVADKTAARTNLGLKGAAVLDVGSIANTVAAGNDSRIVNALQSSNTAINLPGSLTTAGALKGSAVNALGNVTAGNGAAWLPGDGNVYGTVWGGYLSTYIANVIAQARVPDTYGIGSYAFAINSTNVGNAVNPGDVKAGSELKWNNVANYNNGQTLLTGTWRCQGFAAVNDGLTRNTLWMRIS
ncbi:hypothetical protein ACONXG_000508 [Yersinia enterocolitica]